MLVQTTSASEPPYNEQRAKRHLRGWLSYAFASEVFVVVSLTLFLPICLEQFARDNGALLPDKTLPCTTAKTAPLNTRDDAEERCVVKIGWIWIDSASFSLYVYSISVALQALTVISMGGIADHPPHRKRALLLFAALGSISAMLFLALPSSSPVWALAALFAILANVGFGASVVAMNAYLPTLAREDKEVVAALETLRTSEDGHTSETDSQELAFDENSHEEPLLSRRNVSMDAQELREKYTTLVSQTTSRISGSGIALGYFAGIVALIIALIPVTLMRGSTFSLRLAIFASGLWWALFTLPAWLWLPGAASAEMKESSELDSRFSLKRELGRAWRRLGQMLHWREVKRLNHTFRFLGAWFLLSDGFTTITSTALLFGKTQLHMSAGSLVVVGLLVNAAGILGALVWPRIQRYLKWSNKRILIVLVLLCSFIPLYGCFGFLPLFHSNSSEAINLLTTPRFGGLTTPGEMFALAVYFGTVYGAFQAYARAFYAELVPRGEEARWYALYSITDKSSSFLGPLAVGLIADRTGNIRYAFFFLVGMIWSAVPLLGSVNVERGREDAERYVQR
ncbi:autophagy-type protein 22 [Fomitiporia mediterranea MF3/22]|uniref:autophagy-type protein 22 n=1 Tax=Fomitiporia mediterranea (strain MF3/22) TaxID=694068 RepID=UPI0004407F61|nr:autophagy-type protein 22 [Fomitiporia mediterranea MF3/22]EJC99549.1 autophagy-type protein 22 [Fomitiporia mediterranea MF3/22]